MKAKRWITLGALLVTMLAAGVALGEDRGPCYEACRSSGLTEQQMGFDQFHALYGETLCSPEGGGAYKDGDRAGEAASQTLPGKE